MKKIKPRKRIFRINSPVSFGILCALIIALVAGGVYALADYAVPAVGSLVAAANTPEPTPDPTATPVVVTPDPVFIEAQEAEGKIVEVNPDTGEVTIEEPTPTPQPTPEPTAEPLPLEGKTIVIDAAKGRKSVHKGVSSGTYEYKINLAFAQAVQEQLVSMGAKVVMTRESNTKTVTTSNRIKILNGAGADCAVSIMCNDISSSSVRGAEAFVAEDANKYDASVRLARAVLNGYTTATSMPVRETSDGTVRFIEDNDLLSKAKIPTMGIVLGQLSNRADDANLNDSAFMKKAARGIANGIKNFLG